jgi:hypothetical protein
MCGAGAKLGLRINITNRGILSTPFSNINTYCSYFPFSKVANEVCRDYNLS